MTIHFVLEDTQYYDAPMPCKVIETVVDETYGNYDVFEVETDNIRNLVITDGETGIEYEAEKVIECNHNGKRVYAVALWSPIAE